MARAVIRARLTSSAMPDVSVLMNDPSLSQRAGCFASLHELNTHRLRGCVGQLEARDPIPHAVSRAASAVLEDPRFQYEPVTLAELSRLEIELSLLSPLVDVDDPLQFDPENEGIYLTIDEAGGCFLPQVARETGWSRQQLLERLCTEKLALGRDAWKHPSARLSTFRTVIIGPEPFASSEPIRATSL